MLTDKELLEEIALSIDNPDKFSRLMLDFYDDLDRAERTNRRIIYLHIGILVGMIRNLIGEKKCQNPYNI